MIKKNNIPAFQFNGQLVLFTGYFSRIKKNPGLSDENADVGDPVKHGSWIAGIAIQNGRSKPLKSIDKHS